MSSLRSVRVRLGLGLVISINIKMAVLYFINRCSVDDATGVAIDFEPQRLIN